MTLTIPATTQAGDWLYLACTNRGSTSNPSTPTDNDTGGNAWTLVDSQNNGSANGSLWKKKATSGTASKTITVTGFTNSCAGALHVFRGLRTITPEENITKETNSSGDETNAGVTPSRPGGLVALIVFNGTDDISCTTTTTANSGTGSFTHVNALSTGGSDCAVCFAAATRSAATATGNFTWSQTNAATMSMTLSFRATATLVADTQSYSISPTDATARLVNPAEDYIVDSNSYLIGDGDPAPQIDFSGYNIGDTIVVLTMKQTGYQDVTNMGSPWKQYVFNGYTQLYAKKITSLFNTVDFAPVSGLNAMAVWWVVTGVHNDIEEAAATTASGTSTTPNSASITTVNPGALIFTGGFTFGTPGAVTAPIRYDAAVAGDYDGWTGTVFGAWGAGITPGSYDPPAWGGFSSANWDMLTWALKMGGAPVAYDIATDSAAYAITVTAATLKATRKLDANTAAYSISNTAAGLNRGQKITAASAAYSVTNANATFSRTLKIAANSATYAISVTAATLKATRPLVAAPATYSIGAADAQLKPARKLAAATVGYSIGVEDATLLRAYRLIAAQTQYTIDTKDATPRATLRFVADTINYVIDCAQAALVKRDTAGWAQEEMDESAWQGEVAVADVWTKQDAAAKTWSKSDPASKTWTKQSSTAKSWNSE